MGTNTTLTDANSASWVDADAYLFDIDGTLLNTRDLVHWNALHEAMLQAYGVDTTIEGIPYHGKTDLGILRAALHRAGISDAEFETKLPQALEIVCSEVNKGASKIVAEVCPSIREMVEYLAECGKLLGVASGNLESVGWCKIAAAELRSFFQFGSFSDQCENRATIFANAIREARRRIGPAASVCFIGDTPYDIAAAREAEAKIIAVATGIFSREELASHRPDVCVACCSDLLLAMRSPQ